MDGDTQAHTLCYSTGEELHLKLLKGKSLMLFEKGALYILLLKLQAV